MIALIAPRSRRPLRPDTPHSLTDGEDRWPVVDGIPFLRLGREEMVAEVLHHLDRGDRDGALVRLLADQDDWWRGPAADPDALRGLVAGVAGLSLRDAMDRLGWGPVATYFAHRWSDPTFVAGLALVEAHWTDGSGEVFELACGIGHHLREFARRGIAVLGADVVFAKLWIARHFVVPDATLVCFDAACPWPLPERAFERALCHDAFYFLSPKALIASRLRASVTDGGLVLVGHVHNRDWPNWSAGEAVTAGELAVLFPDATVYDDDELTRAAVDGRRPIPASAGSLRGVEAFSLAAGLSARALPPRSVAGGFALPPPGTALRRNPLYGEDGAIRFPSDRYAAEYGGRATYALRSDCPETASCDEATLSWARRRELVDLPDRW